MLKNSWSILFLTLCLLLAYAEVAQDASAYDVTEQWHIEGVFEMPESAVLDSERGFVYVSNVNVYAKDNNGFVSRIRSDGTQLELHWLTGLHSPTGMALRGNSLFVVDFDSLVEVDVVTATIRNRYPAPDSNPALNDVAIAATGEIFVSGSASNSIYRLEADSLAVWLQDDALLLRANGLFVDQDRLVHGGSQWSVFDRHTANLLDDYPYPDPALAEIDGITLDGCGGFLVTLLDDSRIWRVTKDGSAYALTGTEFQGIDLQLSRNEDRNVLVLPRVGGSLSFLNVDSDNCESI